MRILHVTECYGGGVRRAIDTIAELTPEFDHVLLMNDDRPPQNPDLYERTYQLPEGFLARALFANALAKELNVDIVHAHSSWAGVYTRLFKSPKPIVYEPHCFAFDDPQRGRAGRWVFRMAEKILSRQAAAILVLTPHERTLAREFLPEDQIIWLPNIPTIDSKDTAESLERSGHEVVMVGRLAPQKDPDFFVAVAQSVQTANPGIKFTWIGDGTPEYVDRLNEAGVEVTGWLDDAGLESRLKNATLYFHSARYEGFPLSILDAAAVGLPILARALPSFDGFPIKQASSVDHICQLILEAVQTPSKIDEYGRLGEQLLRIMTPEAQRGSLHEAYGIAASSKEKVLN